MPLSNVLITFVFAGGACLAQSLFDRPTFHADSQRTGWISNETVLTPANVTGGTFGPVWNSPQFDSITIGTTVYTPHLFAAPIYAESVTLSAGAFAGKTFSVVFAATTNGFVYAISAFAANGVSPGTTLWKAQLGTASVIPSLDGGLPLGILSTPILDTAKGRLYTASDDATMGWQLYALDITSGNVLPGWPLQINGTTLTPINRNGPTTFQAASAMSQRGALNLSPDGKLLYVPFGAYSDGGAGWMVAADTTTPSLASAFAGAPSNVAFANGGMWESGGAAVDAAGNVYVTTGNGNTGNETTPGFWGQSVLVWNPGTPLSLAGIYVPWNYCQMDNADIDLSGGSPILIPSLNPAATGTPNLIAFGGKQGNMYLVDRSHLPGSTKVRQGCGTDASKDTSLLPPGIQPQFGTRGPLNVFGPYSDTLSNTDYAKSRSTPAYFQAADGTSYIFHTGSSKVNANSTTTIPPGIARLKIVTAPGQPAYVALDQYENTLPLLSPGSPVVTSNGSTNAVLWVPAANVLRSVNLLTTTSHPILYALDPFTFKILWQSTPSQLNVGGKYSTITVAHGTVFVGTDRIQAFGLGATPTEVAINSCGAAAGTFVADEFVSGGHCNTFTNAVDVTGVVNPAPQAVYQSKRTGSSGVGFTYAIQNLKAGASYMVRLHFADDVSTAPGQRVFNVTINGTTILSKFDIFLSNGKKLKAVVKQFTATADPNGTIKIVWTYGSAGNPLASGIEVIPAR